VIGLRHLLAAGLGVGAWLIIGSASAFAADVTQSNQNRSTTVVNNQGAHSVAPVSGPIVAPASVGVGTNANGPVNVNVLSNQRNSGNQSGGGTSQSNHNRSFTFLDNSGADSAGLISGPIIVVPVTVGVGTNLNGPLNVNVLSNQRNSGNQGGTTTTPPNPPTTPPSTPPSSTPPGIPPTTTSSSDAGYAAPGNTAPTSGLLVSASTIEQLDTSVFTTRSPGLTTHSPGFPKTGAESPLAAAGQLVWALIVALILAALGAFFAIRRSGRSS
jgi:hypothetical protein